ncbi:4-(cytidine 5'-diphospho)-2-C-methyl-D-erythritol kinase [Pseudoalteromonas sp. G4]|uniref:4-(cytidine 5'-diphospho)-2-C-methyl-D-erythritol kinase n=1 Tax=Pseudoalteromonas sp. G4 TaxID=2992761 RepID=UPI00237D9CB6|nr:4-(cytidine 5'-diphospho)-2-C-methyl-D-erythritol kinase [Pseudoalteromonas sp. G4]MDE3270543.1 4-(cytidine 5'-diphospho)-2-C-methyl-D-erythritol kinase [Pseudoalteromonas sp. G4]
MADLNELSLIAPAKLNLFLHINGRLDNGYHELETLFVFLDYGDTLHFKTTTSDNIVLTTQITGLNNNDNLIYKAAVALQEATGCKLGAEISFDKRLPSGGGVGGGSSDAATTLLALNALWQLNLSLQELAKIGVKLGADVPVFINGRAAIAHGIGEQLEAVELPTKWYLVVHPNVHISTGLIFNDPDLPRNTPKLSSHWQSVNHRNDCEELVKKRYPEVEKTLNWLLKYAPSRMTGTGACCFVSFETQHAAQAALNMLPDSWQGFVARSTNISPAHSELRTKLN